MFETIAFCTTVTCASRPAASVAETVTSPPASTVPCAPVNSMNARASVLTLFDVSTPPPETPVVAEPGESTASSCASATPSLPVVAVSCAACDADTETCRRSTLTVVSRIQACASDGVLAPSNAPEISGSPSSASSALKRMLDDFQPIELNATTAPNVSSKPSIFDVAVASSVETFSAETSTPAASTESPSIHAYALESTTLVTMTAPSPGPRLHEAVVERKQRGRLRRGHRHDAARDDRRAGDGRPHLAAQVVVVDQAEVAIRAARQPVVVQHRPKRRQQGIGKRVRDQVGLRERLPVAVIGVVLRGLVEVERRVLAHVLVDGAVVGAHLVAEPHATRPGVDVKS